jgi:hypothetical protein
MFWENVSQHKMPAAFALFKAKSDYITFISQSPAHMTAPSDQTRTWIQAAQHDFELKAYWSATCLGLGW